MGCDEAGGGGDGDQAGDGSGDAAQGGGLAVVHPLGRGPGERGGSGAEVRVDEGAGGEASGASALPALKPNQPTQSRQAPMKLSTTDVRRHASLG